MVLEKLAVWLQMITAGSQKTKVLPLVLVGLLVPFAGGFPPHVLLEQLPKRSKGQHRVEERREPHHLRLDGGLTVQEDDFNPQKIGI